MKLLDKNEYGIIYKPIDQFNNVKVLYKEDFIEVNVKRIELYLTAKELYPKNYDLDNLFVSFKDRKLEKDIKEGPKALKKIHKEIKENRYSE